MADAPTTAPATKERSPKRLVGVLVGVIVISLIYFTWKLITWNPNHVKVVSVDQANSFLLDSEEAGLTLIGVEVPPANEERVGKKACEFVSERILNKYIHIVRGEKPTGDAGWILGYAYYAGDDGKERFLNEELLRRGYGRLRLEFPNDKQFRSLFEAAQAEAKQKKLGVWQDGYIFPGR